ncbi:hypothetical protein [Capnocytophaga sp. oral taxon 323]|uniref:hypothetical protein n=1 Tax=Capnocytophaga sp. oral taxon 323 TaxID=1705617 RepID=UPI0006AEB331|nr:hypothetical protein [Capnocytophaga sp. oral taxon 323]ALC97786.1 hypothetical protein AM608_09130 [Capnocytophaga sp. oral taxon 323]
MKKYLFIMSLVIASISCSKSEDKVAKEEVPEVISDTFSATIKDGFTGENGEELILHKSLKNILVGDYIPYTLTIKEKEISSEGNYVLIPTKTSDKNHQSLQVDYEMYLENDKGEKEKVGWPHIELRKAGKYKFYIKPLVPGTFKIPFILLKKHEGKKAEQTTFPTINFNVVKILLMNKKLTRFYNIGDKPMSSFNSIYYFQVDDGDEETDIYLSPKEKTTQTFAIKCNNSNTPTFSGDLRAGEKYTFDFHFYSYDFATITIVQKREGEEELRIEYLNIPVEKRNEDHFERHFF